VVATSEEMKWGITGGSGQLARSLVDLLSKEGIQYVAWDHSEVDIGDPSSIEKISGCQPSVLINCAAWTDVDGAEDFFEDALKVNQVGTQNVAIAARELNIPLIHISSDYVFSGTKSQPWNINDVAEPTSKYGVSKLLSERKIQEIWPDKSLIFRTAWLYSPYKRNFAKTMIHKALASKQAVSVVNDQTGQPTNAHDLAAQILSSVKDQIPSGIYHATNSGQATWWDFACRLFQLCGESTDRVKPVMSQDFPSRVKRPTYSVLDHSEWSKVGIEEMRDWKAALDESFPEIRNVVERELSLG
jgi:dTDP-4-dehydrorhamnose reductase